MVKQVNTEIFFHTFVQNLVQLKVFIYICIKDFVKIYNESKNFILRTCCIVLCEIYWNKQFALDNTSIFIETFAMQTAPLHSGL